MPISRSSHLQPMNDDTGSTAALSSILRESWERSMKHGLRRQDHALFNSAVTKSLEKRVIDDNQQLLHHASPEMVRLYTGLGSARWVSLCVNAHGQVVCSVGDRTAAPKEIRALMHPGRLLLEAELGTTAPGCALEVGQPVVVARGEHYLIELAHFFCACAPIHSPTGEIAGVLDISGVDVESLPLASDMVGLAARAIENNMLHDLSGCRLYRFHFDERLLGTPFEAVMAIDNDGVVQGANRAARQLLMLPKTGTIPQAIDELFDRQSPALANRAQARAGELLKVRTTAGSLAYVKIEAEPPNRRPPKVVRAPQTSVLANGRVFVLKDGNLVRNFERAVCMFRNGLPILLEGETGTGKEVFARALQEAARPQGPFVALNCAAIPEGLIEAELFGYADGAFTGSRRGGAAGKIEQANGGVLFLDEIGDMALGLQGRLLRVLQERVVTRVGDSREKPVDILVLSATHARLDERVARGEFREDLFYRLNGCRLRLPSLREREDVADIARELFLHYDAQFHGERRSDVYELITRAAFEKLVAYRWPGNIRQLEQTIRGLLALRNPAGIIDLHDLPEQLQASPTVEMDALHARGETSLLDATEQQLICQVLREQGGNRAAAARRLGISRTTLYAKLKRTTANAHPAKDPSEP